MRFTILICLMLMYSYTSVAQAPVLAVNRVDKHTKEVIRQSSMYSFKDANAITVLNFSVRAVDNHYFLLLNVPLPATIKKGTEVLILLEDGKSLILKSNNDIISLGDHDISKKMIVCDLDNDVELKELMKQSVNSITIPTSNKGNIAVSLVAKDKGLVRSALQLVYKI